MAYLSLYRKYRSQGFDEILGQKHVTQTLKNALSSGTVAHAYLFTGPRGTGKTSTARVLAKALDCLAFDGPTPDPCGVCAACVRIRDGFSMDVLEIDAASTRGIDDIRDLREKVKFAPAEERYKVYVIDEVHQLTGEAFNALLKTLEEPPPRVVFILATTELHKVPATIMSRCQRFDFRRGSMDDLKERITSACEAEGWSIAPDAVTALAVAANGGYRDALGLLEQVAAFTSNAGAISVEAVNTVLGAVGQDRLYEAADAVAAHDAAACFRIVADALAEGVEVRQFLGGLRRHFRDVLMAGVGAGDETALTAAARERVTEQSRAIPPPVLLWAIEALNEAERDLRWAPQQRLLLETTLVKLATSGPSAPAQEATEDVRRVAAPVGPTVPRPDPPAATPRRIPTPAYAEAPPTVDEAPPLEEPPPNGAPPDFERLSDAWRVLVKGSGASTRAALKDMYPQRVDGNQLIVASPAEIHVTQAQKKRSVLEETLSSVVGGPARLKFIHVPAEGTAPEPAVARARAAKETSETAQASLADIAIQTFDGVVNENGSEH